MSALALEGVGKRVGGVTIARDVWLRLEPGERRALVGPNGAGKTTLFDIAAGRSRPTSGCVKLQGRDVTSEPAHRRARLGLARTFQITNLLAGLSVAENLALAVQAGARGRVNPAAPWRRLRAVWRTVDELLERSALAAVRDTPVAALPYGVQRRLEIVVAVARPAAVILLDEPGAGLTAEETEELMRLVFGLGDELAVMFVEHDVELALRLATQVTVLHLGAVVADGEPDEIRATGVLDDIYLGSHARAA